MSAAVFQGGRLLHTRRRPCTKISIYFHGAVTASAAAAVVGHKNDKPSTRESVGVLPTGGGRANRKWSGGGGDDDSILHTDLILAPTTYTILSGALPPPHLPPLLL